MIFFRSTFFNIAFFGITALMALMTLPATWMKRKTTMKIVRLWVRTVYMLEKSILGLDYEVRGWENVPKNQAFLLAAKHESAYETFKMHILFDDPAIVLKKELTQVPLWGAFIRKSDPIAIDRSSIKQSIKSLMSEVQRVKAQGRPIVVFPQGTRVKPTTTTQEKPYKSGIARMQEASGLPIIPLALNTGLFWPKMSWVKKPGKVIFEFLPAIEAGQPHDEVMKILEIKLESASAALLKNPS
jgi:1-acyl-sn-glycerol-3-phosphate acyltransferase